MENGYYITTDSNLMDLCDFNQYVLQLIRENQNFRFDDFFCKEDFTDAGIYKTMLERYDSECPL
ncbi:hypothetical protein [Myroides sp. DW712]|uniref:hypothetical protein n=1 Tax=Myroides sp. DW712 TaxID=3389800 RepID=UPI00397D411D